MKDRKYSAGTAYRYGFNGKENDNEVKGEGNQQDYGMRIYDPRLGRFLSVDPLSSQYPFYTPFQYASNSPIANIDLDGLETWAVNPSTGETASGPLFLANFSTNKGWVTGNYVVKQSPPVPQPQTQKMPVLQTSAESTAQGRSELQLRAAMTKTAPKPMIQSVQTTVSAYNPNEYEKQQSADRQRQMRISQQLQSATMDQYAGQVILSTANTGSEYVKQTVTHAVATYDDVKEENYLSATGNGIAFALDIAPVLSLKGSGSMTATAYRAVAPEFVESTSKFGFYKSGNAGRLGNDGIYANTTVEGAIAEFTYHNPGVKPVVFEVKFKVGKSLKIEPPTGYFNQPLPFTQGVNILEAGSLRAPGTTNLLIREGATPGKIVK